jgi:hypothetical protein
MSAKLASKMTGGYLRLGFRTKLSRMPRKKKPDLQFPPEIRAIWHAAPNLTLCPKFRRASADRVFEHIKQDRCERCLAVYRQLAKEADLISFLMSSRN